MASEAHQPAADGRYLHGDVAALIRPQAHFGLLDQFRLFTRHLEFEAAAALVIIAFEAKGCLAIALVADGDGHLPGAPEPGDGLLLGR